MALIKCKSCGCDVSDKARVCPNCGQKLVNDITKERLCTECGSYVPEDTDTCPKCGCPFECDNNASTRTQKVEVTKINLAKLEPRKKKIILGAVAAVVVIAIIIAVSVSSARKRNYANYQDNYNQVSMLMLQGAAKSENACNLIVRVWGNAIDKEFDAKTDKYTHNRYKFYDFNEALDNLFADEDFASDITEITENRKQVSDMMNKISYPPDEFKEAYDEIKDLYDVYQIITKLAENPTGSYNSYSSEFSDADNSFMTQYNRVELYCK